MTARRISVEGTHAAFGVPRGMTVQQTRDEMVQRAERLRELGQHAAADDIEDAVSEHDLQQGAWRLYGERPKWRIARPEEPGDALQIVNDDGTLVASVTMHGPDDGGPLDGRRATYNLQMLVEILLRGGVRP